MMRKFTMSQFATEADLYKANAEYFEAENEKLQKQVAMLQQTLTYFTSIYFDPRHRELAKNALQQTESDWLAQHDQQVRDEAYEKGRNDMHDSVMREWDKPAQVSDAHIGDRLRNLKGTKP